MGSSHSKSINYTPADRENAAGNAEARANAIAEATASAATIPDFDRREAAKRAVAETK